REQREALQYGGTFGAQPLREEMAKRSTAIEGIDVTVDQILITSGSAHAIGVACEALIDPGDIVLSESPSFSGSLRTMRTFGAELRAVQMDEHGIRVLGDGFAKIELKVPRFVTTHRESGAIVPLDEHAWPTELPCDIR
ncbi:MAG: aminotransferase class I/II-fold pyridoxal phosphate-dependent enzyme, partial [Proteobacteria bacterium]|nr:aminotransferase class I/II-fold pyridoxal phosphate-dependent enzyme [Pseudomonadota bacterium]